MTAKTPDSPQESRPPAAASSTSAIPQQSEPPTVTTTALPAVVSPPPAAPKTPGKPAKPVKAKPPARSRGGAGLTYVVSVLAVLIALGSTVVALYALDVARDAKSRTADVAGQPAPVPGDDATPSTAASAVASPTPTRPRLQFTAETQRAELRVPPADGCVSVFVDLDSMQVGVDNGHEFYLSNCLGSLELRIDRTSGAATTQPNPSPEVCVALLAGPPTNAELRLPARAGLTFCLLTNKDEAVRQGQPQRVGIVEVRAVNSDRSVTLAVSTYRVPE
jgi:hypothetical protein